MGNSFFNAAAAVVFVGAGLLHATRAYNNWSLVIADYAVPMWVSWLAVLLTFLLAFVAVRNLR